MKSLLFLSSALFALAAQAAVHSIVFNPANVPAILGRDDVPVGTVTVTSDLSDFANITLSTKGSDSGIIQSMVMGGALGKLTEDAVTFRVQVPNGTVKFDLFLRPQPGTDLRKTAKINGNTIRLASVVTRPNQHVTDANRTSKCFRIPGIVQTNTGTLVAVFDNRFNHWGDLPADITIGVSTSKDGGTTWSPITTALTPQGLPGGNGIGDPAILLDPSNNRLWISALRAPNSGHPIWSSAAGSTDPQTCGQWILAYSDDEGKTWSEPINITAAIKRPNDPDTKTWGLVFQGPGAGIAMRDGTLVFPGQIWGNKGRAPHHGILVYSKDHGKTWHSSKAMPFGGSESTVAEIEPGILLLNTREGGGPKTRVSAITQDMGETWTKLDTTPLRQPGNLCQAALLNMDGTLVFSNPNAGNRSTMTLRTSKDKGKTWSKGLIYDARECAGYSSLCPVGNDAVGVIYEGTSDWHYFQRVPMKDLK